jgi:hypothetical protein
LIRWNVALRLVPLVCDAAYAASTSACRSQRLPLRTLPPFCLPALSWLPGHIPAPIAHLRARTWKHMYASKVAGVGVRPRMRKAQFMVAWNERRSGARLSNWQLERHFAGDETYYFCACPNKRTERMSIMIDIDVQKTKGKGTPEGARAFAEHLRKKWPDLYVEPSTHGLGQHGYIDEWHLDLERHLT